MNESAGLTTSGRRYVDGERDVEAPRTVLDKFTTLLAVISTAKDLRIYFL